MTIKPTIAILGAGPSGLTLGGLLTKHSIPYVIFERDVSSSLASQGGTLDIHTETGQVALKECGLFSEFEQLARYDGQAFKAVDKNLNVLADLQPSADDRGRPEIDRKLLRSLLLKAVPAQNIKWDKKVDLIERSHDGSMNVKFVDGSSADGFRLIVGADGAWSKARNVITSAQPQYSGRCYLQFHISPSNPHHPTAAAQVGRGTYFAASDGRAIIAQHMGNDSYNVYAGLSLPANWSKGHNELCRSPRLRDVVVKEHFGNWNAQLTDLITKSDPDQFYCWSLFQMDTDAVSRASVPGVTLVGDAAHLALPNGEGVNAGMFDALELCRHIVKHGVDDLDEAVRRYEKDMVPRAIEHIRDGQLTSNKFFADDTPAGLKEFLAALGE